MNKTKISIAVVTLALTLGGFSCKYLPNPLDPDPIVCTEEFRIIGLEVKGGKLDSYFTLWPSTGDTLNLQGGIFDNFYPVLDDSFQPKLEGKTDEFIFVGFQKDKEVVRESFKIKADQCHIEKVSGPESVTL